jgi:hypothetical protein
MNFNLNWTTDLKVHIGILFAPKYSKVVRALFLNATHHHSVSYVVIFYTAL